MTTDTIPVLVCMPLGWPGYAAGPDYDVIACPACGRLCWIGPRQRLMRDTLKAAALCGICAAPKFGELPVIALSTLDPQPATTTAMER